MMSFDGDSEGEEVEDPFPLSARSASTFLLPSRNPIQIAKGKKMWLGSGYPRLENQLK